MIGIIPGILILLAASIGVYFLYREEKAIWNNGTCKENGLKWVSFDTDSSGATGYRAGDTRVWLSWAGGEAATP